MIAVTNTSKPVSCCSGESQEGGLISHCPMAAKFDKTFGSPKFKLSLCVIGVALIVIGIAIILEPRIVIWLMASVSILMGMALLVMAYYINSMKRS